MVRRSHPQPDFTFLGTGPGTRRAAGNSADRLATLSAGDQYFGLDSFGRVIDHHWKTTGGTTDRFAYTYDRNSNRLTKDNAVNSDFNEAYTYDNLNQLTGFDRNSGDRTQAWDFDALGNWDSLTTDGGSPQTRTHNKQNEITAVSGATTPTFDANGNMTTDETGKQYVYDAWNRLKVVKNSGGTTLKTYVYDALNRRVAESAGGATTDFYYSASWQVLEERDTARTNDTKARYVWSPVYVDAMILRDRDTADDGTLDERLWVQQDANFNVTALVDDNGDVVERYVYDPYGVATVLDETWSAIGSSAYGWVHLHQGGRLDATSGLYHFRMRDYSPTLGRWVTMDPKRYGTGDNSFYRYVGNVPVAFTDAIGLERSRETQRLLQDIWSIFRDTEKILKDEPWVLDQIELIRDSIRSLRKCMSNNPDATQGFRESVYSFSKLLDGLEGDFESIFDYAKSMHSLPLTPNLSTNGLRGNPPYSLGDWLGSLEPSDGESDSQWRSRIYPQVAHGAMQYFEYVKMLGDLVRLKDDARSLIKEYQKMTNECCVIAEEIIGIRKIS
ncbi:MAG: RHS repeat-associated core domain-containing protein [Gemmataceae bacterium]|nr:RHS repeat-associated core domain-containing protein [Gemmataceae bacterium]